MPSYGHPTNISIYRTLDNSKIARTTQPVSPERKIKWALTGKIRQILLELWIEPKVEMLSVYFPPVTVRYPKIIQASRNDIVWKVQFIHIIDAFLKKKMWGECLKVLHLYL